MKFYIIQMYNIIPIEDVNMLYREAIFSEIKEIVEKICSEFFSASSSFFAEFPDDSINLKKKTVRDADDTLYKICFSYISYINRVQDKIESAFRLRYKYVLIESRTKSFNSVIDKIERYKNSERHKNGKTPLNKCLNDLFGIRMILDMPISFSVLNEFLTGSICDINGIKFYVRDASNSLGYKATHIIFKYNNFCFPWELQIWNPENVNKNRKLHKKYKQGYTSWENEQGGE